MNVGELKKLLNKFPDNLEVICDLHSDYGDTRLVEQVEAVPIDGWIMRSHPTMSEANKAKAKQYLYIGY